MSKFINSPFEGELEIVATLAGRSIEASLEELKQRDELTIALRAALRAGVSVDELSAVSGLTPMEIRSRVRRELFFGEDLNALAGTG